MKKLLLVLFVAGFVGLAFAYSPAKVSNSPENGVVLMEDTTKATKKTTATKKDCTAKKSCCKSTCSEKKSTTKKEKKN